MPKKILKLFRKSSRPSVGTPSGKILMKKKNSLIFPFPNYTFFFVFKVITFSNANVKLLHIGYFIVARQIKPDFISFVNLINPCYGNKCAVEKIDEKQYEKRIQD